ncbi:AI-2E family transporter [Niabella drilacis]|uniref:Predicted PurR-regulated permease PerM n=1 Tax=Niabella drilacis (strain DSM 25811 / CCM 8410 / CCUG 62505 / LMG 26954 / E90) TaxID=1285928 RepID=A0A1G6U0A2_NIADE|nr:AI-2E family transporter [Niabella drilacis]SDD34790.1 Predicted PurR-regulated permease PerM [Niabella drilacis]
MNQSLSFLSRLALVLFCIISIGYLLMLGQTLFAPLFFSFLMALLFLPLALFLERKCRFKRTLATTTVVILMLLIFAGVITFFSAEARSFTEDWPRLKQNGLQAFYSTQDWISTKFHINAGKQWTYINQGAEKLFSQSATIVSTTLSTVSSTLIFLGFTLLFTFFILNYRKVLYAFLVSVFSDAHKQRVAEIVKRVKSIIKKYIIGLLIQMLIVSAMLIVVLSLLGVKYAILLGFMGGIFNVIPYLGILTALLFSCLVTFATIGGAKVLLVITAFIIVHAIDSNVVMPIVVGSKVKLNPMIAFIGIIIGEMLWGISGMFLCIPFLAILKIIFDRVDGLHAWGMLMGEEGDLERGQRRILLARARSKK